MKSFTTILLLLAVCLMSSCNKSGTSASDFGLGTAGEVTSGVAGSIAALSSSSFTLTPNSASTVTVVVVNTSGAPLAGKPINFILGSASYGTLSSATATTDADGLASVTYTAPATNGAYNIVATSAYGSVSVTALVS